MHFEKLLLYSGNISSLKHFYSEVLKCPLLASVDNSFEMQWGYTLLRFEQREDATPYHFAINIPPRQIEKAAAWVKERVALLPGDGEEIIDFSSWDALSVYFYDSDNNIVELIARRRIDSNHTGPFSANQFLGVSEIGAPVENVEAAYNELSTATRGANPIFSGSLDIFCAVGDDNGLFIVVDKQRKNWYPTGNTAHSSDFELVGRHAQKTFQLKFRTGHFTR